MTASSGASHAAFSLGANLGDREAALAHAVGRLLTITGYELVGASEVYETEAEGGPDQPDYLNQVVVLGAQDEPEVANSEYRAEALLNVCHSIESDRLRVRGERWGPRTLDVDILAIGDFVVDAPELTIPHPHLAERAFVLIPWADVDPGFVVPGLGSVEALADRATKSEHRSVRQYRRPQGPPD
jgi:2-amino-4-hydroxy-6-hydroxymethyldihydropteridine diphosphokinase